MGDEKRNPIDFESHLVDTIQTTVFVQSRSNFACKLWMIGGGSPLFYFFFGHGVKGQGQLWHSVYKTLWTGYRLQFLPNHFQTYRLQFFAQSLSNFTCKL